MRMTKEEQRLSDIAVAHACIGNSRAKQIKRMIPILEQEAKTGDIYLVGFKSKPRSRKQRKITIPRSLVSKEASK
ncbi:MAG: hypothetical protein D4S01_05980 [Dehalococcoidia bacterium]|nr:MAG: hypothetical protein D4S01_05980 [Dehalococcoidia bacterium]